MSLQVRCRKCNMKLNFDIRSKGLIVVVPCEACVMSPEDVPMGLTRSDGPSSAEFGDTLSFDSEGSTEAGEGNLEERIEEVLAERSGTDDDNASEFVSPQSTA